MFRALLIVAILFCAVTSEAESITVSAAISLKDSLLAIAADYKASTGNQVNFNFGASGLLMRQIQQSAPVDAFISAALPPITKLQNDGLLVDMPPRIIACNQLVLIVPIDGIAIDGFGSLLSPGLQRIAIGQTNTVPAGGYAMQVLDTLCLTAALNDRLIYGANAQQVLQYVARGEVDAGIVYASDIHSASGRVRVVATALRAWHEPIIYPAVVLKNSSRHAAAARFLDHLLSDKAQSIFAERGFLPARKETQR